MSLYIFVTCKPVCDVCVCVYVCAHASACVYVCACVCVCVYACACVHLPPFI